MTVTGSNMNIPRIAYVVVVCLLCYAIYFCVSAWILPSYCSVNSSMEILSYDTPPEVRRLRTRKLHPSINIVNMSIYNKEWGEYDGESAFPCVKAPYRTFDLSMCVYPPEEDHTSRGWLSNKAAIIADSYSFIDILIANRDAQFIDIGPNLGTYTLPAAHIGMKVLAVEANKKTARVLRKSLVRMKAGRHVTLLNNGLTNVYKNMSMAAKVVNKGSNYLVDSSLCKGDACLSDTVQTVMLDDLIPLVVKPRAIIKIDIQGSEIEVLNPKAASKFFKAVDVPYIQMEFEFYQNHFPGQKKFTDEQINNWLPFFYDLNYIVRDIGTNVTFGKNWRTWPRDILLVKKY